MVNKPAASVRDGSLQTDDSCVNDDEFPSTHYSLEVFLLPDQSLRYNLDPESS